MLQRILRQSIRLDSDSHKKSHVILLYVVPRGNLEQQTASV